MLWEVEIRPASGQVDREGERILAECSGLGLGSVSTVTAARSFLLEGDLDEAEASSMCSSNLASRTTWPAAL
jgi:phosphoribosylformylglycinamidine (FGAM) synthase PurS component